LGSVPFEHAFDIGFVPISDIDKAEDAKTDESVGAPKSLNQKAHEPTPNIDARETSALF